MSKKNLIIIMAAGLGMMVAAFMLLKIFIDYKIAENEYSSLQGYTSKNADVSDENATLTGGTDGNSGADSYAVIGDDLGEAVSGTGDGEVIEEKKELKRNYIRDNFPDITVDFEGLKAINSSFVCWLYAPGADIDYPVVQCGDNDFYLHHTFERKQNSAGCIFMDYEVDPELTSWNTFIYGHNMKNGTMFGHLKNYINNSNTYDKYPYIYIFRPEGIYRYEIFSYYLDSTDSKMYYTCDTFKEYRQYLREAKNKSVRECSAKVSPEDNILTLVTCSGSGSNKKRFFVHSVFVDRYLYE